MTEYWVSQGNKWCDYCKIFIANNATSIRTHEFGQRHKDNVAKKLAAIRKDTATKEKEKHQAIKDLERIEAQARRSYEKDLAASQRLEVSAIAAASQAPKGKVPNVPTGIPYRSSASTVVKSGSSVDGNANEWIYDEASGYYFNAATGYYYDSNSGLYYSDLLGKWTTQEEAFKASRESMADAGASVSAKYISAPKHEAPQVAAEQMPKKEVPKASSAGLPGPVLQSSQVKSTSGKGVASSVEIGKRKRQEKTQPMSKEEADALAAREAARKRTLEREKGLLGLYQSY